MQIVEIFLSIQGEGKYTGKLAIFIRFAGCNFNCSGFGVEIKKDGKILKGCDTIRAVFTQEFKQKYKILNANEIFNQVIKLKDKFNPIIVITGGEPLIYHQNPEFITLIKSLLEENFEVHFESNGSIEIDFLKYSFYKECIFALSVKLENSGVDRHKRLNFKALKSFKNNSKDSFYKFVLDANTLKTSSEEISEILKEAPNEVFCMPMGENQINLDKNAKKIAEFCIKNGYNYSDRIHIRLWNDKESV
ncbi:7-carboxy-7-deazaguanine synthase QueE [Campylobacter sp. LH-2024]|uniref:7-carboxy-7-deazaguanine synthase QueE n=1 Tax=Campylobacter molothri TaxID=1032242 RepID=A0ACC5W373_9BACT|nr:7-carboxy-7-deazaguanine synthase QueE [Campylobacter sp. 2018MI35]MBZ7928525.1 7-carboxy-7-deazaguanine synthase QueE [Campylobacter sp. RM10542]MBZ7929892.1 7-carboxy-7-deazaguanine synthase QueE [Campylobacter sp. W0067]MBZ7931410.1 7-carboxy-7-deazaguanine synthase QueE [Campylobacter sp. RM12910]MBZ7932928.1 7-carboxy-7-deazaguanine synthase QueE [Campylobacter sp. RM10543]MBZ7934439.1 7-carboxy-7-deazaguanine synthase QueE [Campylobacter sp. W0065]MBZ7937452.1 7-carboxy-7-deazaguanin